MIDPLPRYDLRETYDWNFDHAPDRVELTVPTVPGDWSFCGRAVPSPLGVPAGPLLNGRWCLYYAGLGFDVLTYKTVRSREHPCYQLPNLQPVRCGSLTGSESIVSADESMSGSWAVSYGMPSKSPAFWRADVESTRRALPDRKLLSVSVVGTVQPDWSIDDLADDYAQCARWAIDSGADFVEANFSCPNVSTCDGQLYQNPKQAAIVAERLRTATGDTPLLVKIGHVSQVDAAEKLLAAVSPHVDALAMTNSVAMRVSDDHGQLLFDGQQRGICGAATLSASVRQVELFHRLIRRQGKPLEIAGVGGVTTADDVRRYLDAGATSIHIATAAMVNPRVALEICTALATDSTS